MIFLYTGQPGHGKTVLALEHLLRFKAQGRDVYACNVRKLDYERAGVKRFSPEEFRDWPNQLPTGSVLLVDECYEHDMLPKRRPGSAVPEYVKQLAKHRHNGYDFIFVCQSPAKQVDEFVHDLVEEHYHVRRRFGLPFVHVRRFDRYERYPEKATPLVLKRRKYPKHIFQLYESTQLDTSEKRVPWYYFAATALLVALVVGGWWTVDRVFGRFTPSSERPKPAAPAQNGAAATVVAGAAPEVMSDAEWLARLSPRFPGLHGSQPIFDDRQPAAQPRTLCVMSGGDDGMQRCRCYTEQATRLFDVRDDVCRHVARWGQYDPFLPPPTPGQPAMSERSERDHDAGPTAAVLDGHPSEIGTGREGEIWGRKPETLRGSATF